MQVSYIIGKARKIPRHTYRILIIYVLVMLLKNRKTAGSVRNLLPRNIKIEHIFAYIFTMTSKHDYAHG